MRASVSMENWDYGIVRDFEPPLLTDLFRTSTHPSSFISPLPPLVPVSSVVDLLDSIILADREDFPKN